MCAVDFTGQGAKSWPRVAPEIRDAMDQELVLRHPEVLADHAADFESEGDDSGRPTGS
jgi:hypothetical protein